MAKHFSYSALKMWNECPFKYKLTYIDNLSHFSNNEYTAFGTALHEASQRKTLNNDVDEVKVFSDSFTTELSKMAPDKERDEKLISEMKEQGAMLAPMIIPALKEKFGSFTVLEAEEEIYEKISSLEDWNFKGFIDLIIKTDNDNKIHIIDWKSCAWGWDAEKKSDAMITYQLTLYKYFFAQKHNTPLDDIETYFALLKRTAKKDNVEIFRVTSGAKKISNALSVLSKAIQTVEKKFFPKNRLSCKYCEFYKTKDCP